MLALYLLSPEAECYLYSTASSCCYSVIDRDTTFVGHGGEIGSASVVVLDGLFAQLHAFNKYSLVLAWDIRHTQHHRSSLANVISSFD